MRACLLLSLAASRASALCATEAACRLVSVSFVTIFAIPVSVLHHALSACFPVVRGTASVAAIVMGSIGAWALYAILVPWRLDLAWLPAFHLASAGLHAWTAYAHREG